MLKYLFFVPLIVGCEAETKPDYQKEYSEIVQVYDNAFVEQIDDVEKDYELVDEKILRLPWMYGELPFPQAKEKLKFLYNQYKDELIGNRFFQAVEKYEKSKQIVHTGGDIQAAIDLHKEYLDEITALTVQVFPEEYDNDVEYCKMRDFCFDYQRYVLLNFIQGNALLGDVNVFKINAQTNKIDDIDLRVATFVKTDERLINNRNFIQQVHDKMGYSEFEKLLYKEFGDYATVILCHIKFSYYVYSEADLEVMEKYLVCHPQDTDAQFVYAMMLLYDPYFWPLPNRDYQLWLKGRLVMEKLGMSHWFE